MGKKILSPSELIVFRAQKEEEEKLFAVKLEEENNRPKRILSPSDLFRDKIEIVEEQEIGEQEELIEEEKSPIEILQEKIDLISKSIITPKYYDKDISEINDTIGSIRRSIFELPEVKYYDNEIKNILEKIKNLDIRYYESEIEKVDEKIDQLQELETQNTEYFNSVLKQVLEEIQRLSELEIPDDKEIYNYIDSVKESLAERVCELKTQISEFPEIKYYDDDLSNLKNEIEVVRESIPEIPEIKCYDEDLKIINETIETIRSSIPEVPEVRYYENEISQLEKTIDSLKNEIPEVKYYDKDIKDLRESVITLKSSIKEPKIYDEDIEELKTLIEEIREKQETLVLSEGLLNEPPENENKDPLTPLNQNFATLDDLQKHYKLFINRIQQQLSTIGGGGETKLKYLDDIVGIATNPSAYDGKFLKYNHSLRKFEFVSVGAGSQTLDDTLVLGNTSSLGITVGVTTVTELTVNGDALFVGVVTATDFNSASDVNLKNNISTIENPLDKISKIDGVNFQWKDTGKKSLGVIAQQVEKVLPELVSGEDSKTVNYNGIIGLLVECVKEQQREIEELKALINK